MVSVGQMMEHGFGAFGRANLHPRHTRQAYQSESTV
jgi:hypothetical protein